MIVVILLCIVLLILVGMVIRRIPWEEYWFSKQVWSNQMIVLAYIAEGEDELEWYKELLFLWDVFPLQQYTSSYVMKELSVEDYYTYQKILLQEARGDNMGVQNGEVVIHNIPYIEDEATDYEDDAEEFFLSTEKMQQYNLEEYTTMDQLIETFYIVDAQTVVKEDLLNIESLLSKDMTLVAPSDQPQILIYHTHSQEAFVDSIEGDPSTTIVEAGVELTRILRETYGYNVMHITTEFDKENRDAAYSVAEPVITAILEEYPSIEVVLDDCVIIGLNQKS